MSAASEAVEQSIAVADAMVNTKVAAILNQSVQSRFTDVLTDLAHWSEANGFDFLEIATTANNQAESERFLI